MTDHNDAHPLFPPRDDESDPPEVAYIHITRSDGHGRWPYCPRMFAADELTELQQIADAFGGGDYELIARAEERGRITDRRRYSIAGPSKPLVFGEESAGVSPPAAAPAAAPADMGSNAMLTLMMSVMANQQQMTMAMMQQTTSLLTAVMQRDSDASKAHVTTMQQLHDRSLQSQAQLMQAMVESKGGSSKELVEVLREGLQMGREISSRTDDDDEESDDDVSETLGQVARIMETAEQLQGGESGAKP